MAETGNVLITGRRNFLVRALGFTAAGATLAVPVLAVASPEDRIQHHLKGLQEAFQEFYGRPAQVTFDGNYKARWAKANYISGVALVSTLPERVGVAKWYPDMTCSDLCRDGKDGLLGRTEPALLDGFEQYRGPSGH